MVVDSTACKPFMSHQPGIWF